MSASVSEQYEQAQQELDQAEVIKRHIARNPGQYPPGERAAALKRVDDLREQLQSLQLKLEATNRPQPNGHAAAPVERRSLGEGLSRGRLIIVTIGTMLALLLAALDQTIVGTAMPRIVADLNGLAYYTPVTTVYLVASTVMVPIAGKLGDLFGRKPFLLTGMIGFVGASALCGLSQNMLELVAFRGIQGIFGGILFATVFTVIGDLYPPAVRARVQGLFGAVFGLSSVLGPTVGGYLTDNLGWRWVFYVNVPVGILAVLTVASTMPFVRTRASWRDIDFAGAALLVAGVAPLLTALTITRDHAWTSFEVLGLFGIAAVMLGLFFIVEQRGEHPIVPFRMFTDRTFSVSVIVGALTGFAMFGSIIFVPLIYQGVLGISATNSGQLLTPMMLGLVFASVISGQLMVRIKRYRFLGTAGIAVMMVGMWLLSQVTTGTSRLEVVRDIVIVGAGLGTTFPLYINAVQSAVSREFLGVATSQIQFWRNMGGTIGTAVLGSLLVSRLEANIQTQMAGLPPAAANFVPKGASSSAQTLFDASKINAARGALPPQLVPLFDQVLHAIRVGLANSLHEIFLLGAAVLVLALLGSVFLKDVPLRGRQQEPGAEAVPVAAA
ncbi:MAG: MFS transporter [Candidatus Dormibacteraeota bacterium]|nr:MFS transporter [Candidatus Dormibacteraeota bacterium]